MSHEEAVRSWRLEPLCPWTNQGDSIAARKLLIPIYGWFTEGLDTVDLKDAKGLLDELST